MYVCAPTAFLLHCETFLAITTVRRVRSAALFVGGTSGSFKNRHNRSSTRCFRIPSRSRSFAFDFNGARFSRASRRRVRNSPCCAYSSRVQTPVVTSRCSRMPSQKTCATRCSPPVVLFRRAPALPYRPRLDLTRPSRARSPRLVGDATARTVLRCRGRGPAPLPESDPAP